MTPPDQATLHRAITTPNLAPPGGLSDGHGRPAGRRFWVYRNNVAVSLREALRTGFPAVASLIGEQNFSTVARTYAQENPPDSPLLMLYGAGFPAFLDGFEPLAHIRYLGDVARLEHAMRRAYHAADSAAICSGTLRAIALKTLMDSSANLAPATTIVRSVWPVHAIRAYALDPSNPKPAATPQNVLITRPDFDPVATPLPAGGAEFVEALARGATFAEAHDQAAATASGFDPAFTLGLLLDGAAIASLNMKNGNY
ncbi:DNA-binding domain-containing protein [Sediminimonas sp.]|uniref:HvfC/BufC N-terminal domain-containing protein n=1 Tax=Sediminimonas sp. TaxID=2823379 RepID=UPI0025ECD04B|nr:DNA-binding domain-containing protein [Sediminimonas sp.]